MINNLDLPARYRDKDFDNYDISRLKNSKPELILEGLKNYGKKFMDLRQCNNWIFLTGGFGVGKTHLAVAVMKEAARQKAIYTAKKQMNKYYGGNPNQGSKFIFKPSSDLIQEIKNSYDSNELSEHAILEKYKNCHLLILDDLGTERASEWQQEKLHLLLNYRYNEMLPTIITTNMGAVELNNQISQRLFDRIIEASNSGNRLWRLKGNSYRQRAV